MNNDFTAEPTISPIVVSKHGLSDFSTIVNPVDSMIIRRTVLLASITDTQADSNMVAVCAQTCNDNWSGICRSISRISFAIMHRRGWLYGLALSIHAYWLDYYMRLF